MKCLYVFQKQFLVLAQSISKGLVSDSTKKIQYPDQAGTKTPGSGSCWSKSPRSRILNSAKKQRSKPNYILMPILNIIRFFLSSFSFDTFSNSGSLCPGYQIKINLYLKLRKIIDKSLFFFS